MKSTEAEIQTLLLSQPPDTLVGILDPADFYGPHYLTDLRLGFQYSTAEACGKGTFYEATGSGPVLRNEGRQYKWTGALLASRALARLGALEEIEIEGLIKHPGQAVFTGLALDEFHYLKSGALRPAADLAAGLDLVGLNQGLPLERIMAAARRMPTRPLGLIEEPAEDDDPEDALKKMGADWLYDYLAPAFADGGPVRLERRGDDLKFLSALPENEVKFYFPEKRLLREDLNLRDNNRYTLPLLGDQNLRISFNYFAADGQRIGFETQPTGTPQSLLIPADCQWLSFGLRFAGPGWALIKRIDFGARALPAAALVVRGPDLVIIGPQSEAGRPDPIRANDRSGGLWPELVQVSPAPAPRPYRHRPGLDVLKASLDQLAATLALGQVGRLLLCYLNEDLWKMISSLAPQPAVVLCPPPGPPDSWPPIWRKALSGFPQITSSPEKSSSV